MKGSLVYPATYRVAVNAGDVSKLQADAEGSLLNLHRMKNGALSSSGSQGQMRERERETKRRLALVRSKEQSCVSSSHIFRSIITLVGCGEQV